MTPARIQRGPKPRTCPNPDAKRLSPREWRMVALIADGQSNREIAEALHLTEGTVRGYVYTIMGKIGHRTRLRITLWALAQQGGVHA